VKELLILSGKGGTGKTTLAAAFIHLAQARTYADCDVDAPNLHLIAGHKGQPRLQPFYGLPKAQIDPLLCTACDLCRQHCRFGAIQEGESYSVNPFLCEGCAVCDLVCPAGAVTLVPAVSGDRMLYKEGGTVFSTARLRMGNGMSGLLVSEVKKVMRQEAVDGTFAILDGSPGIGCPVIASLSAVHMVLVVAEPSVAGISDMERIVDTAMKLGVRIAVCVNKYDTNPAMSQAIEDFCQKEGLAFMGRIPYDPEVMRAVNQGLSIAEVDCPAGRAAREVYGRTMEEFLEEENGGQG